MLATFTPTAAYQASQDFHSAVLYIGLTVVFCLFLIAGLLFGRS